MHGRCGTEPFISSQYYSFADGSVQSYTVEEGNASGSVQWKKAMETKH